MVTGTVRAAIVRSGRMHGVLSRYLADVITDVAAFGYVTLAHAGQVCARRLNRNWFTGERDKDLKTFALGTYRPVLNFADTHT